MVSCRSVFLNVGCGNILVGHLVNRSNFLKASTPFSFLKTLTPLSCSLPIRCSQQMNHGGGTSKNNCWGSWKIIKRVPRKQFRRTLPCNTVPRTIQSKSKAKQFLHLHLAAHKKQGKSLHKWMVFPAMNKNPFTWCKSNANKQNLNVRCCPVWKTCLMTKETKLLKVKANSSLRDNC